MKLRSKSNSFSFYHVHVISGAGTFFGRRGAQNSKIVLKIVRAQNSKSGERSPPDHPFLECTFLGAGHTADLS